MRKCFIVTTLLLAATYLATAQEKRALVIGIDKYSPPDDYQPSNSDGRTEFRDLDGCINDAKSIQSIIVSRFMFSPDKVDTLFNEAATRNGVLKQMNALLEKSKAGDVAFIYYAGHGSQVKNSASKEKDKKDESMVPSDTWKQGVEDIRDKELAKLYNKFIDKGVKLTVIMDCCHSGSLSRGPNEPGKFRYIAAPNYDVKDPSAPTPPETRKEGTFLILSAAQDNEFAQEQKDEKEMPHGAFTIALIQALEQQSVNTSVLNLFSSIRAILKSNGKKQEPVLGGSESRQQQTLFGLSAGSIPDKSLVPVSGFDNDRVILQGGFALGLYKENELAKFSGKDTLVKLRVDTVLGINKSLASVVKGNIKDLKAGEFLEVTNWVSSGAPPLKLYIPTSTMNYDQVIELARLDKDLKQSDKIKWINDLEKNDPCVTVFYNDQTCLANIDGAPKNELLKEVNMEAILQKCKQDSTFYFELPPGKELAVAIRAKLEQNKNIKLVNSAADAHYVLYGTIDEAGKPSYGLRRAQTSARDSLESMPVQTINFVLKENNDKAFRSIADSVYEYAMRLFKVRSWLQLAGPKKGKNEFPFHLELINDATGKPVDVNGSRVGDNISLHIAADKIAMAKTFNAASVPSRYVYVFAMNRYGKMELLYPGKTDGNVYNRFPHVDDNMVMKKDEELIGYEVIEPVGTDNIFLLATDEPIATYALLFEQEGVRADAGMRGEEKNPLASILDIGNDQGGTRSITPKTPLSWVLYRLPVKSRH